VRKGFSKKAQLLLLQRLFVSIALPFTRVDITAQANMPAKKSIWSLAAGIFRAACMNLL
jgi:hypothetical protein